MKGIRNCGLRILIGYLALFGVNRDAQAGFQWITGWQWGAYGHGSIGNTEDKLDGVSLRDTSVWGAIGSSYPVHDVYFPSPDNALTLNRSFSLTDVDEDQVWRLDLDLRTHVQTEFSNFGSLRWYYVVGISGPHGYWRYIGPPGYLGSLRGSNGVYTFGLSIYSYMSISDMPTPYSGYYKIGIDTDLRTSAVPEPSSWLMIGPGLVAIAGFAFVSKRKEPGIVSFRKTEPNRNRDRIETSGIEGVRS